MSRLVGLVGRTAQGNRPAGECTLGAVRALRLGLVVAAGVAVAVPGMTRSLWIDEAHTYAVATAPTERLLSDLAVNGGNMSLYLLVMRGWLVFGSAEWWMRVPSLLFAASTILVLFYISRRYVSDWSAVLGCLLLAVSVPLAEHASSARSYTLLVLLACGAWVAALRLSEHDTPARRRVFVVLAVASIYAHTIAALVVAAQLVWLQSNDRRAWRLGALIALLAVTQATLAFGPGATPPMIAELSGSQIKETAWTLTGAANGPVAAGVVAVWGAAIWVAVRRKSWLPAAWVILPTASLLLISTVRPMLLDRYLIVLLPGVVLCVTIMLERLPRSAALGVVAFLGVVPLLNPIGGIVRSDWRAATRSLIELADTEDRVVFVNLSRHLAEYYWHAFGRPPAPRPLVGAWRPPRRVVPALNPGTALPALDGERVVWLMQRTAGDPGANEVAVIDHLERHWDVVWQARFGDGAYLRRFERQ